MYLSNGEYFQMFVLLVRCEFNSNAAASRYRELHPGQETPSAPTFRAVASHLCSDETFQPDRRGTARSTRSSMRQLDATLAEFERDGTQSLAAVSRTVGLSERTIGRHLHENGMHPYKQLRVQTLLATDYVQRIRYSRWLLGKIERNPSFCKRILWTDEALFTREECFNAHNSHVWSDENPFAIRQCAVQVRWSINLWAGICGDFIIGPYVLPERLDGATYTNFLQHVLPDLLEEIPLEIRRNMYYQHVGAPAHYSANARAHLD